MSFVSSVVLVKGLPLILSSALTGYSVEAVIETSGIVELWNCAAVKVEEGDQQVH